MKTTAMAPLFDRIVRERETTIGLENSPRRDHVLVVDAGALEPSCCMQGCMRIDLQQSRDGKRWTTIAHAAWTLPDPDGSHSAFDVSARKARERRRLRVRLASFEPMSVRLKLYIHPTEQALALLH